MAIYSLRVWDLTKERSGKGKNNKYLSRFTGLRWKVQRNKENKKKIDEKKKNQIYLFRSVIISLEIEIGVQV